MRWQQGLRKHVERIIYDEGEERMHSDKYVRTVAGYMRSLANKLDKVADHLPQTKVVQQVSQIETLRKIKPILTENPDLPVKELAERAGVSYESARKYRALYRAKNNLPAIGRGRPRKVTWENSTAQSA